MEYVKTAVHDCKNNCFAKKVFEELNKYYKISLQSTEKEGRYKIENSVFGNNQMFSENPGIRSWFKEPMAIGERKVYLSSDWWLCNFPGKKYARTIFDDLLIFVEELTRGDYTIKDEGTDEEHDYWLYKRVDGFTCESSSFDLQGINPNHKNAKSTSSTGISKNTDNYPNKVIVDYQSPYDSFCWRGGIHLEIDLTSRVLVSDGWHSMRGTSPLNEYEEQKYIEFFCNVRNLQDFFNDRLAYNTPAISMGAHYKSYECRIQWGEKDKTINVGKTIPYDLPF